MTKTLINILKFIIPLGLGVFLIWWVVKDLDAKDKEDIRKSFLEANYFWILIAMLAGLFSHLSRAYRWLLMLEPLGYKSKFRNSFFAVAIGYGANLLFPRLGEVVRCGVMNKYEKIPLPPLLGTVVAERLIDMLILLLLTFITLVTQYELLAENTSKYFLVPLGEKIGLLQNSIVMATVLGILFLVVPVILFFVFRNKLKSFFNKISGITKSFAEGLVAIKNVKNKGAFIFHSLAIWTLYILMLYFSTFALAETKGLSMDAMLAAFVFGTFGMVFSQGGIGFYPLILQVTLQLYGASEIGGFAFGWLTWTSQTLLLILLAIASLILVQHLNKNGTTAQNKA